MSDSDWQVPITVNLTSACCDSTMTVLIHGGIQNDLSAHLHAGSAEEKEAKAPQPKQVGRLTFYYSILSEASSAHVPKR